MCAFVSANVCFKSDQTFQMSMMVGCQNHGHRIHHCLNAHAKYHRRTFLFTQSFTHLGDGYRNRPGKERRASTAHTNAQTARQPHGGCEFGINCHTGTYSISLSLSNTHTHARMQLQTHAHAHAHENTQTPVNFIVDDNIDADTNLLRGSPKLRLRNWN